MIFNFNPKEYCFSSAIPDNFVMTGFQGDVVTIWIFLNRDVSPIFSTDIAAYKGRASIYDLRGIIEGYMETHGLAFATCTIKFQEDRNDYALGEFTIFYCNLLINMDCKLFLLSHFLYSENTRLVPRDMQFDLQYFVFPNESGASSTQFLVQAVDGAVASYSVQGNWVVPKELEELTMCKMSASAIAQPSVAQLSQEINVDAQPITQPSVAQLTNSNFSLPITHVSWSNNLILMQIL